MDEEMKKEQIEREGDKGNGLMNELRDSGLLCFLYLPLIIHRIL